MKLLQDDAEWKWIFFVMMSFHSPQYVTMYAYSLTMALAIKVIQTESIEIKKNIRVQNHSTIEQSLQIGKEKMS